MMASTKNDASLLPTQLAAELAGLDLPGFEQRRDAINGSLGAGQGVRARYLSQLEKLRRAHGHSELLCGRIGSDVNRQCDSYLIDALPPADSGQYVGFPRST